MDTDLLKTFLEVSRTRHFGRAAENLYLTRSAVSFRIKQLESILGVPLFERLRNNIHLTPSGERMIAHAETILTAWERTKQDISLSSTQSLQLAIGVGTNIWESYLKNNFQALHVGLPGISLRTDPLNADIMARQLLSRSLDLALSFDALLIDELELLKVANVTLRLFCTEPNKNIRNVQDIPYVKVNWGTAFNIQHAQDFECLPIPVLHTGSAAIALEFILQNKGMAFVPEALAAQYIAKEELFSVANAEPMLKSVYLAYSSQNERISIINKVIPLLKVNAGIW